MANWTEEAIEKAKETRRKNKEKKAQAEATRQAELAELRAEVERLRGAGTVTISASEPAEMATLRKENEHLKECMEQAGLLAFMSGKSPEHVGSHLRSVMQSYVNSIEKQRQHTDTLRATIADQKALLTYKSAQLFKSSADNMTLSKGLSTARAEIADLEMVGATQDAEIARLRLESDEMQDELDAASFYAGELKEELDRRSPAGGVSSSTVMMAINILRTASDTLALALEDDGRTGDDDTQNPTRSLNKSSLQWSATETVGIGIVNPERVRKTEDDKTVLVPTTSTIESTAKVTEEDAAVADMPVAEVAPAEIWVDLNREVGIGGVGDKLDLDVQAIAAAVAAGQVVLIEEEDKKFFAETEEALPSPLPAKAPLPLEEMTMLQLNRLAVSNGLTPCGTKPRLLQMLTEKRDEVGELVQ
jgi:hypothetical protein